MIEEDKKEIQPEVMELDPRTDKFISLVAFYSPSSMDEDDYSPKKKRNRVRKKPRTREVKNRS